MKAALVKEKATIQDRMVTVNDNMPNMDAPIQKPPVISKKGNPFLLPLLFPLFLLSYKNEKTTGVREDKKKKEKGEDTRGTFRVSFFDEGIPSSHPNKGSSDAKGTLSYSGEL